MVRILFTFTTTRTDIALDSANDIDSPEGRRALENRIRTGKVSFHDAVWHRVSADGKIIQHGA